MRFIVKGINDEAQFCECCGKDDLKKVVWIEDTETGEIKHFGTTCALQPVKGFDCIKEIKKAITDFQKDQHNRIQNAGYRYRKVYNGKWINGEVADKALWEQCCKECGVI